MSTSALSPSLPLEISTIPSEPEWLSAARRVELARFSKLGLPSVKEEDWRFTNLKPLAELSLQPASGPVTEDIEAGVLTQLPLANVHGSKLVFINGHFSPEVSSIAPQAEGVRIVSLAVALIRRPELVEKYLLRSLRVHDTSFASLNAALFLDGAFVYVPEGTSVSEPVHVIHIFAGDGAERASHPRNLIVAERGSRLTIIESYAGSIPEKYFTNAVTELVAGDEAGVEYLKFQDETRDCFHLATVAVSLGRSSKVRLHSMAFGSKLSRTNFHTTLAGEGAECLLNGLYLVDGEQLADHYMIVDHAVPHGTSHEYFNGILAEKARGVFHGRIIVEPDAQKTDAKQTNKNLLLSDDATIDTKPQLEIYADDVKCTHGATVGQLSDEAVFYLRSRGIPREKARQILIHAFAGEIIDRIHCDALRQEMNERVSHCLEQNHFTDSTHHDR